MSTERTWSSCGLTHLVLGADSILAQGLSILYVHAMVIHSHDAVGMVGIAMIVGCYLLLQTGRMQSNDLSYSVFNGLGALCVLYSIYFAFNLSALLVESFWAIISAIGIIRYFMRSTDDKERQRNGS